jgi:hypothetical protein
MWDVRCGDLEYCLPLTAHCLPFTVYYFNDFNGFNDLNDFNDLNGLNGLNGMC